MADKDGRVKVLVLVAQSQKDAMKIGAKVLGLTQNGLVENAIEEYLKHPKRRRLILATMDRTLRYMKAKDVEGVEDLSEEEDDLEEI